MATVTLNDVGKSYGALRIIERFSLGIADGEFVTLVGPSGCGKSTLLRMIAGLEPISAGEIAIGDRVVNEVQAKDRDIAMVFQNYALYPHMTVWENMGFSLRMRGETKRQIDGRVRAAAATLGLADMLDRYPRQLSGGQRQRVAMGRAIVRDPQVFLFDEPLSNLDAKLRVQMRTEIKEMHQRLKTTTIYVTHDQIEALTMADKVVVMRGGVVEQVGAPLDVYDRPANMFVAGFIGSPAMNFLPGIVDKRASAIRIADDVVLPATRAKHCEDGEAVICGIRPEHFGVAESGNPAVVSVVEPTGSETMVFADMGGNAVVALLRDRHALRPGETIRLSVPPERIHLFDPKSQERVCE